MTRNLQYIDIVGGDVKKLGDELLSLCDKLEALNENVEPLREKISNLSKSAIEQIKEKKEANEKLLADLNRRQPLFGVPSQLEETMTEPGSPCEEKFDASTEVTNMSRLLESTFCTLLILLYLYSCCHEH